MIDRKGQLTIGLILMGFLSIIVGLILIQGTFPFIGASTNSYTLTNATFTLPAVGASTDLRGQELLTTVIVSNATTQQVVPSGAYTVAERVSPVDGLKRIAITTNTTTPWAGTSVNVSYGYGQEGYIDDAGGRGVAGLIPIMAMIALLGVAIGLAIQKGWFD